MNSPITITEIGRRLGVSAMTVSNVLNRAGQERFASKALAQRIREVAAETGYVPNQTARNLKSGKTNSIVLLAQQGLHYPYVYEVVEGIQKELGLHHYHLNLELRDDASERAAVYNTLFPGRCDGAIVLALDPGDEQADERRLMEVRRRVPVVVGFCSTAHGLDCVDYDRLESTRLGIEHLLDQRRRRIAIVIGLGETLTNPKRLEGCREAFTERGLTLDQSLVFEWGVEEDSLPLWWKIQALPELPDAIFSYNEEVAMSLMRHIRQAGLDVPRDIAITTVGNTRTIRFADVPLTAVDNNHREIAKRCVDRILAQIENKKVAPERIIVQPKLFIRGSSVCLPQAAAKSGDAGQPVGPSSSTSNPSG